MSAFYDADALERIAINLFYGWGYNFYRLENQLRADDLLVRAKVSDLLGTCRETLETAQSSYRRKYLPPPSRAKPRPDAEAIEHAQSLEQACAAIGRLEGRIRALPVPENDRMTQRYRQEAATLLALRNCDTQLVGQAELLRQTLADKDYEWVLPHLDTIKSAVAAMTQSIQTRQDLLH